MKTREIKFRIWHKPFKGYLKEINMSLLGNPEYVFQQFIGLFDSSGKEIYEGDYIQILNNTEYIKPEYWLPIYEIIYLGMGFCPKYIGGGLCGGSPSFYNFDEKKALIL